MSDIGVESFRSALESWASDRLARVYPLDGREGREYRFLSTDWFGLLQKCYWQSEELVEQVVNTFLRLPSVAEQPRVLQVTRGVSALKLTFAQGVSFLRDRIDYSLAIKSPPFTLADRDDVPKVQSELVVLRMFADRRNAFTHGAHAIGAGNEECVIALTSCVSLCQSRLVVLAMRVEQFL